MTIATFRCTYQFGDGDYDTATESKLFNDDEPIGNILDWYDKYSVLGKSHLEIRRIEELKTKE